MSEEGIFKHLFKAKILQSLLRLIRNTETSDLRPQTSACKGANF
jgi:hypothetical protein